MVRVSLSYRARRRLGRRTWLNVSKSGASITHRLTDRITVNTRGRVTVRILPGLTWRLRLWR